MEPAQSSLKSKKCLRAVTIATATGPLHHLGSLNFLIQYLHTLVVNVSGRVVSPLYSDQQCPAIFEVSLALEQATNPGWFEEMPGTIEKTHNNSKQV